MPAISVVYNYIVEQLSRVTSGGKVIPEIDGFRFFAIAQVFLHQALGTFLVVTNRFTGWKDISKDGWFFYMISHGNFAVQFFFAITIFVLIGSSILFILFEKPFMKKEGYKKIRYKLAAC